MMHNDIFKRLKLLAKRHARSTAQPLYEAQNLVASKLGCPHWNALTARAKGGWAPSEAEVDELEALLEQVPSFDGTNLDHIFGGPDAVTAGELHGHPYELKTMFGDVFMVGEGWEIHLRENPLAAPQIEIDQSHAENSPMQNLRLRADAIKIAQGLMQTVKARRFADWPRRATKPDAQGRVRHPFLDMQGMETPESNLWYCLHCNGKITGPQIAKSQWHCPGCGASPINIFQDPFWLQPDEEKLMPVKIPTDCQTKAPIVSIVDRRLRLELNKVQVEHLIRSALSEDATNASERIGASLAEIRVDDDLDVFVSFEDHYWPEDKEPHAAREVAALLGIEIFEDIVWTDPLFAWPGLATVTQSTAEYTRLMLNAYRQREAIDGDPEAQVSTS